MKKTKEIKRISGITLITLVVTIVVLLILAGVTIAVLTGDNGIITQAKQAKDDTNISGVKEKVEVEAVGSIDKKGNFNKEIFKINVEKNLKGSSVTERGNLIIVKMDGYKIAVNGTTGDVIGKIDVEPGVIVNKTEKDNYSDGTDKATVPQGFTVSGLPEEQTIANGLVIYDIPESEISNVDWNTAATKYNQFVWIPVEDAETYQRNFSYPSYYDSNKMNTPENSTFTDMDYLPIGIQPEIDKSDSIETAERSAVLKYNGFYIARYEAGNENSNVVSKQNVSVYVGKSQTDFKTLGKEMYGDESNYVKSAMCSGIQWDMVMKFVDGKKDGNENIYDVRISDSNRHTGSRTESGKNVADKVQNIYDLEGNCFEYVAEKNTSKNSFIPRGGGYNYDNVNRASNRYRSDGGARNDNTFRPVLYIK